MMTACVVHLEAAAEGPLADQGGRAVHGLWFRLWGQVAPEVAARLHADGAVPPFTLSPLMGLPRPQRGQRRIARRDAAWFRITTLTEALSAALESRWLPALPDTLELAGLRWRVTGWTCDPAGHPWAGRITYGDLIQQQLFLARPPHAWSLRFETPAAFHGAAGHLPFPLPDSLVRSWMRRWQAFAPLAMPPTLPDAIRQQVVVSGYRMRSVPVRQGERLIVGGVGWLKLRARRLPPDLRAALNALAHYAFYCGSGAKTTQGLGLTRLRE